jgi:glucose-specific phosphotransferase system IIA component
MALDYHKCAEEIYSHLGGKENIASAAHCATRLRLAIVDNKKVDTKAIENVEGVKGVFENNGQLQIIIGTGTVNKVYDEFLAITGLSAGTKEDVKAAAAAQMPVWKQMLKALGDVFVPILPAIVASGLMMGLVEALGRAIPGFSGTDWYSFLDMVANTAFSYLPVLVAVSAAKVFGGNVYLGAVIGLLMIHSNLINAWDVSTYEGTIPTWHLLGFTVRQVGYQGHVIPVIIAVWFMSKLEQWLHKHVPEMIDLFVVPLVTVMVTALLTFCIIGPIFSNLENLVLAGAEALVKNPVGAALMGALYPWTVVMGLHHMYNIIEAGMLTSAGLNTWMPIASAANFAQFGACLAVGLRTRDNRLRQVAIPSSLSASLGITEPAIFGVNLRLFKPFIAAMIAGAAGSLFAAFSGIGATSYGVTGLPGYLTINHPGVYTILLAISGGLGFVLTNVLWKPEEEASREPEPLSGTSKVPENVIMTTSAGEIKSPVSGKVIPASAIPDPMFAQESMGPSVGIQPTDGIVYAPFDGSVMMLFPTNHAIGLRSDTGIEVLIHIGVDTVNMNGDGFTAFVQQEDKVAAGQKLLTFDRWKIAEAGHPDTVIVAITNAADLHDIHKAVE